jgi:citrate synthase
MSNKNVDILLSEHDSFLEGHSSDILKKLESQIIKNKIFESKKIKCTQLFAGGLMYYCGFYAWLHTVMFNILSYQKSLRSETRLVISATIFT